MKQSAAMDRNPASAGDAAEVAALRRIVSSMPLTIRPSHNQKLAHWELLFPFEQNGISTFIEAYDSFDSAEKETLTAPLREIESKMGIEHLREFSESAETMENSSLLARSPYFLEWRKAVQVFFDTVEARAEKNAKPEPARARLIVLVIPDGLPIEPNGGWNEWKTQAVQVAINGNPREFLDGLLQSQPGRPSIPDLLAQQANSDPADLWLIDGDVKEDGLVLSAGSASRLSFAALKPVREKFLDTLNNIPKDLIGADQVVALLRATDWKSWCPPELARQPRLLNFMIDVFLSGNGALNFPSAFTEWTASEALRRARPRVVIARFGMRSKPKPFTSIAIFANQEKVSVLPDVDDPENSAVDAEILARYIWLAARRYPEYEQAVCVCIAEHLNSAWVIARKENGLEDGATLSPATLARAVCSWLAA
jgi:hypothetical protein